MSRLSYRNPCVAMQCLHKNIRKVQVERNCFFFCFATNREFPTLDIGLSTIFPAAMLVSLDTHFASKVFILLFFFSLIY